MTCALLLLSYLTRSTRQQGRGPAPCCAAGFALGDRAPLARPAPHSLGVCRGMKVSLWKARCKDARRSQSPWHAWDRVKGSRPFGLDAQNPSRFPGRAQPGSPSGCMGPAPSRQRKWCWLYIRLRLTELREDWLVREKCKGKVFASCRASSGAPGAAPQGPGP